jgi:hypothetical protein
METTIKNGELVKKSTQLHREEMLNKVNYYNPYENLLEKVKGFYEELDDSVQFLGKYGGNIHLEETLRDYEELFFYELNLDEKIKE